MVECANFAVKRDRAITDYSDDPGASIDLRGPVVGPIRHGGCCWPESHDTRGRG